MESAVLELILEITVFSAVIFLVVLLFRWALKKWLSPRIRYLLWFLVIVRLLVPVTWEGNFHLFTLPEEAKPAAVMSSQVPVSGAQPGGVLPAEGPEGLPSGGVDAAPTVPLVPNAVMPTRRPLTLSQWLSLAWGAGAVIVLTAYVCMAFRLNRRIRLHGCPPGSDMRRLYDRARETLGIRREPPVLLLPDISSPALTAGLCPKLLLPEDLIGDGTQQDKVFSLLHELMHFKRGDHLVCLLLTVLRGIWWFNPVVWLLPQPMRSDMESACDAQIVQKMDKQQKLSYASLLLELGQKE